MKHFDPADGWACFQKGVYISGRLGKSTLKDSKDGLVYQLLKTTGEQITSSFINSMSRLSARRIEDYGFSFGIEEVTPDAKLR